ncbi:unnamed protein product [Paramecium sonneborni]|uniref:Uncharacterized protein n=1 Tax=Paramecium sonneborni TaxID=65129 RepID=A0A8S1RP71_9CILI|nr:unnamed protein product [Paramecium sonneborni]
MKNVILKLRKIYTQIKNSLSDIARLLKHSNSSNLVRYLLLKICDPMPNEQSILINLIKQTNGLGRYIAIPHLLNCSRSYNFIYYQHIHHHINTYGQFSSQMQFFCTLGTPSTTTDEQTYLEKSCCFVYIQICFTFFFNKLQF